MIFYYRSKHSYGSPNYEQAIIVWYIIAHNHISYGKENMVLNKADFIEKC